MGNGSVGLHLNPVDVQQHVHGHVLCNRGESLFFPCLHASIVRTEMAKNRPEQGLLARVYMLENYTLELTYLHVCVSHRKYIVNSITLARCIMRSETHFLQLHRE